MPIGPNEAAIYKVSREKITKAINKIDTCLTNEGYMDRHKRGDSTHPYWIIKLDNDFNSDEKELIIKTYLKAGWSLVSICNNIIEIYK